MKNILLSLSISLAPFSAIAGTDFAPFPLSPASLGVGAVANGCHVVLIMPGFKCHPDPFTGRPIITPVQPEFPEFPIEGVVLPPSNPFPPENIFPHGLPIINPVQPGGEG